MGERAHLLVVDDDPEICSRLDRLLPRHGIVVSCASTTRAALWLARHDRFDAALIEAALGGGASVIALVHHLAQARVPIVLMTGEPEAMRWLEARSYPYLRKPFRGHELRAAVGLALRTGAGGSL